MNRFGFDLFDKLVFAAMVVFLLSCIAILVAFFFVAPHLAALLIKTS